MKQKTHEDMMRNVIRTIKKTGFLERNYYRDHNGKGQIRLFTIGKDNKRIEFSYPDIIITKNEEVKYIIEIKFKYDNTPKAITGIIHSTNLSSKYSYKGKEGKLSKPKLFIVLDDDLLDRNRKRAKKPFQIDFIREKLDKEKFNNLEDILIWSETEFLNEFEKNLQ